MPGDVRARIERDRQMIAAGQTALKLEAGLDEMDEYAAKLRGMSKEERHKYLQSIVVNFDED